MCCSGRTRNVESNHVGNGRQGDSDRYTDGQVTVWGSPHTGAKVAFDVSILVVTVEPNSNSNAKLNLNEVALVITALESLLNVNAAQLRQGMQREPKSNLRKFFHERLGLMGGLGRMAAGGRQTCQGTVH